MKTILVAGAACALALALSGCAGFALPGVAGSATGATNDAFKEFLTDPNCSHHDEANLVTGAAGMPASFSAKLVRDCPARSSAGAGAGAGAGPGSATAATTP
jgi:hypothetical protein